jgi:hypothetical protein
LDPTPTWLPDRARNGRRISGRGSRHPTGQILPTTRTENVALPQRRAKSVGYQKGRPMGPHRREQASTVDWPVIGPAQPLNHPCTHFEPRIPALRADNELASGLE